MRFCRFYRLAVGARFTFGGQPFSKIAMSAAWDERNLCQMFLGQHIVEPVGEPLLLPPEEAERWKPKPDFWTEVTERLIQEAWLKQAAVESDGDAAQIPEATAFLSASHSPRGVSPDPDSTDTGF